MRRWFVVLLGIPLLSGCGTLTNGRGWGEDAIVPLPTFERLGKAAANAALDPMTWVPALGAAALRIDHSDQKVSEWATARTPIFGSNARAHAWGDYLLGAEFGATFGTALATPAGEEPGGWVLSKLRGFTVEGAALGATVGVSESVKFLARRPRPLGPSHASFPSGHAATAFALATLTSRNLDAIDMPVPLRIGFQAGGYALATGVAWSRVEAGDHYPTDVLAGAAIGHFVTAFIHDAFLGLPFERQFLGIKVGFSRKDAGVVFEFSF